MSEKKKKIIVGMSSGVDSSTAAAILKSQGYDVTGVFLRFWKENKNDKINKKAIEDVQEVCKVLSIPLKIIDARKKFKNCVVKYFLDEYKSGRTPNPCVFCNENIKFKLLFDLADDLGVDYVATGHYAQIKLKAQNSKIKSANQNSKFYSLFQGKDKNKDQSYFLYRLKQKQLKRLVFPLGNYTKLEVRQLAKKSNLPVFDKSESQNICFIKDDNTRRFLSDNLKTKKGKIIDLDGKIIGGHQGLPYYTLGQRRGINIGGTGPYYVVSKDIRKNILYVTNKSQKANLYSSKMSVGEVNWIANGMKLPMKVLIKTRYRQEMSCGIIKSRSAKRGAHSVIFEVEFEKPERAVTPGQSAVFYAKNGEVLGGGIIIA